MKHLKSQHYFVFFDTKQPRIDELLFGNPFSQDLCDQYLLEWIVKEDQPFTQLESKDFIRILTLLEPNLKKISQTTYYDGI